MSVIVEAINITANVMASAVVETYEAGGNPALGVLAAVGLFAILSSVIRDSGKTLAMLFIVCVAAPFLLIEKIYKKYKEKNGTTNKKSY